MQFQKQNNFNSSILSSNPYYKNEANMTQNDWFSKIKSQLLNLVNQIVKPMQQA